MKTPLERLLLFCLLVLSVLQLVSFYNFHWTSATSIGHGVSFVLAESPISGRSEEEESVSACLLVMDDNHYLIEWLAYHYHVMPLRHVVISTDPNSQTSPSKVLERWKKRIVIEEWRDKDFMPTNINETVSEYDGQTPHLQEHRARQWIFNLECLKHLKKQNKGWVLLTDTDEYTRINNVAWNTSGDETKTLPSIEESGSVLKFLNEYVEPQPNIPEVHYPCVFMYRRQFSAKPSSKTKTAFIVPRPFDAYSFQTLRWRHCDWLNQTYPASHFEGCSVAKQMPGKTMIDLKRIRTRDLLISQNEGNPHSPLQGLCPVVWPQANQAPLVAHHYTGTVEQWNYRKGDKRGQAYRRAFFDYLNDHVGSSESDHVRPWLQAFVNQVGAPEAARLLHGVGQLEPLPHQKEESESSITIQQHEVYRVGDKIQARYKGGTYWYWAEILKVYPDGHYNVLYDDCSQEFGIPGDTMIRRNGTDVVTDDE